MIGSRVRWKHLHKETGAPIVDCEGIVRAAQLNQNGLFLVLIEKDDGTFAQQQALDLCLVDHKVPVGTPGSISAGSNGLLQIGDKIAALDLLDQVEGLSTADATCHLLDSLMAELTEAGETILTLQAEVGKKTKSKAKKTEEPAT